MDSIKSTRNLHLSVISANQNILINDHSKSTDSTVKYNYKTVIYKVDNDKLDTRVLQITVDKQTGSIAHVKYKL